MLLVDDSAQHRKALYAALEPLGARLVEANSGEEALRLVLREDFAAILLDAHLGSGLDGLEMARLIRSRDRSRAMPLVLLIGSAEESLVPLGDTEAQTVDFLLKPFRPEVLRGKVSMLLELYRTRESLRRAHEAAQQAEEAAKRSAAEAQAAREEMRRQALLIRDQEQRLTEAASFERLHGLLMRAPAAICVTRGEEFIFEFVNPLYEQVVGRSIRLGAPLAEALPEVLAQPDVMAALRGVMRTGEPFVARGFPVSLRRHPDGQVEPAFFDLVYQPLLDTRGQVEGLVTFAVEVTEATQGRKQAESLSHELAQREEQLRTVTDAVPALISFVGRDGRYHLINRGYTEWFGLPREQLQGRLVREVLGETAYETVRPLMERVFAGEAFTFEREMHYRQGARHVRASYLPHRDASGEVDGYVALIQDVSEELLARGRAQRLQDITSTLLTSLTPDDIARAVLKEATGWLQAKGALFYVRDGDDMLLAGAEGYSEALCEAFRRIVPDAAVPVADVARTGEALWLESLSDYLGRYPQLAQTQAASRSRTVAVLPMPGPRAPVGVLVLTFHDERRLEATDRAFLTALARQAALALERARLYDQAQRAVRAREDFLSVAAHELRTPLTSLQLQLQRAERALGPDARVQVGKPLGQALRQVGRLAQLVESLLDVSRIAQGRLEVELRPVNVGALMRDVAARMEPLFAQAKCPLQLEVPEVALAMVDAERLDQVFVNLLSNAAKYGAGKPVHVRLLEPEGHVRVEVRDAGIGIAPEMLPRLFGRFERAASERHYGGLGLGLYITRQLVEAMGGRVSVESRLQEGSTFTVVFEGLPRADAKCEARS
ncbi:MAG TPA: PAS domain-containing protein [Myxococcaceae bacterium]